MTRLMQIIDEYRDSHGQPSYASIARSIGISSQGLNAWKQRGIKEPPNPDVLRRLADLLHLDYESVVLRAALLDAGWVTEEGPSEVESGESETG